MPGMGQAPQTDDPTVVSAFHSALAHQGLLILFVLHSSLSHGTR